MSRQRWSVRARVSRRLLHGAMAGAGLLFLLLGLGQPLGMGVAPVRAAASSAHPNRFEPRSAAGSVLHRPQGSTATSAPAPGPYAPPRQISVPMQPARVPVDPGNGAHFMGSDGVLELDVPAGAVTAADVAAAGGSMSLLVRQVLPASGSSAGGSGHYSFGTYLVQLLDASGRPAGRGLRSSVIFKLHHDGRARALDLRHAQVLINPSLPSWFDPNPPAVLPAIGAAAGVGPTSGSTSAPGVAAPGAAPGSASSASSAPPGTPRPGTAARQAVASPSSTNAAGGPSTSSSTTATGSPTVKLGAAGHQAATADAGSGTLSAVVTASSPTTGVSFDTNSPVATFGRPDPFEVGLSAGALTARYPIEVPAGPGGLTPPISLAYSSAGVSEQHNPQGAAPWVGEGWNLSLGAISWAEHQVQSLCTNTPNPPCVHNPQWEDSWQLSDPFGTGTELVPPNIDVSTYNDDTGQGITPSPITWHTAPETRDRVVSFNSSMTLPGSSTPAPCFRVWLPSGIMEEFGCTGDSLQWYPQPAGTNSGKAYIANWLLDLITDPSGNQVHVSYQQDMASGAGGSSYPRDAVPATVEWDSPGCLNAQAACTGSSWAPLMRVSFVAAHAVAHVNGSSCAANGGLRCDDPADLSGSGGIAAPTLQSSFVLNDVQVQVRSGGGAAWSTLRDYRLGYDQSGPSTITDPVSGTSQSVAGRLNLTQLQESGADGSTSLPASVFQYTQVTAYYEDSLVLPNPTTNCGPSWNTGKGKGCVLWSQSYAGNSSYLSSVSNGLGLAETFSWQNARNNFHGVNGGGSNTSNPFYCNSSGVASAFPCNMPDDETWSRVVLTQKSVASVRLSQAGQGGAQSSTSVTGTTAYSYQVTYPLLSPQCSGCQAISYWGNQNDNDYLDYYNYRFAGFAQATVALPDGSAQLHKFFSTEGTGLYDVSQVPCIWGNCHDDPFWDTPNAAHGHEYELDQYGTDGTTLLRKETTRWAAACPPAGVGGTPYSGDYGTWWGNLVTELDHSNPVAVCEVRPLTVDRHTFDGSGSASHSATAYAYDGYGRLSSQADIANTGSTAVADGSGNGNAAALSGGVTEQVPGLVGDANAAMTFDGSSGFVAGPALSPLQGDHDRSVELWFSTTSRAQQALLDGGNAGVAGQAFEVGLTTNHGAGGGPPANRPGLYVGHWGDDVLLSDLTLTDGRPHHVVVTLTGASLYVYVDGQTPNGQVWNGSSWTQPGGQPFALPSAPSTAASPLWIGRTRASFWGNGSAYFDGTLDEAAVYDHVLPSARVQAHYGAGSGYRAAVLADSPTAYYRLDDGTGGPGPNTIVHKPQYVWNDGVTATASSATGTYIIDQQAFDDVEDLGGSRYQCIYGSYDGQGFATGQSSSLTRGLATTSDRYTDCGNAGNGFSPSGQVRTTHTYDASGNRLASSDPDANAGSAAHVGCTVGSTSYSACTTYDGTFDVLPTSSANALNQTSRTTYATAGQSSSVVADSSGLGNQGTWSGGVILGAPGLLGSDLDTAMGFDGGSGAVTTPLVNQGWSQLTVEAWFKLSSIQAGTRPRLVASSHTDVDFKGFQLEIDPSTGTGFADVGTGSGHVAASWTQQLTVGATYHYVLTYDGTTVRAYLNGTQVGSGTGSGSVAASSLPVTLGRDPAYSSQDFFPGVLDEVAIYGQALSASRVGAHYAAGASGGGSYRAAVLADAPTTYYRLDDSDGFTTAATGFGLWPVSTSDANGQTTSMTYDALGRETSRTLPGESAGLTTGGTGYTAWCSGTSAQAPCVEVDHTQRLNATTTVTSRAFYDGLGHLVETRSPAPNGQDTVRYSFSDPSGRLAFQSVPYLVAAYSGPPGAGAYSIPDSTQAGTTYTYDGLGRTTSTTDALSNRTATSYAVVCGAAGTNDPVCYEQTLMVDALGHQGGALSDALGRKAYEQRYTGSSSSSYAVYATSKHTYDYLGDLVQVLHPDGSTRTTYQYDPLGRKTAMTDPDLGSQSYGYDQDGNLTQSVDARGTAGTIFVGYDGLDRQVWRNASNTPAGAYDTYGYDSTAGGSLGVGRLTSETFSGGSLSGSRGYAYDVRGQLSSSTLAVSAASAPTVPTGVSAVAGNGQATVTWTPPATSGGSTITGYTVTASPGGQTASVSGSTLSAVVTGLSNGTGYTFTVRATNVVGTSPASAASNQAVPATVPGAPAGVTAVAGNGQATVSWTPPASGGGGAVTGYTVLASPGGQTVTVGGAATSATVTGLSNGTAYTFTVKAASWAGTGASSAASSAVTPAAASGATFVQRVIAHHDRTGGSTISATTAGNVSTGDRLVVEVGVYGSSTSAVTDSAGNTYVKVLSLVANDGTQESVWTAPVSRGGGAALTVTASDQGNDYMAIAVLEYAGLSQAADLTAVDQQAQARGTTSAAGTISSGATGAAGAANELAVGLYGDGANNNTVTTGTGWTGRANDTPTTDVAVVVEDQTVAQGATANASFGTGSGINWMAATVIFKLAAGPATAPTVPTGVSAVAGNGQATVTWTPPATNGGSTLTGYTVTASPGGQTGSVSGSALSAVVTGLSNGTSCTFTVTATNAVGTSPASAASNQAVPATVPGAPAGVTAVAGNGQATVSWAPPAGNGGSAVSGYTVTSSGGQTASVGGAALNVTMTGLSNGTGYTFTVGAANAAGGGPASAASNAVTPQAAGAGYTVQTSYDDAGNLLSQVYPDGETVTNSYSGQGWLSGVSTQQGSTTTTLLSNAAYAGVGGAFGELTGANLAGTTYRYSASYDLLDRATDLRVTRSSGGTTLFEQSRTFDAAGNVATASTTLPGGTDNQAFCYDEQDRLTWAGSTGTPPCTGTAIGAGSLTAAQFTQSFTYDTLGRLASGPLGTYLYGDPAHVHAASAIGTTYTASYDASGDMTCRAPTTQSTCAGASPNGAQLGFNNEGELATWQSGPSSPSSTAAFLYDGEGQRVAQQTTQGGGTTTTVYVGGLEEVATSGSTTTTTAFYYAGGKRIGLSVNGSISYLAADALGSANVTLDGSGSATASVLYAPYGNVRYGNGAMPTTYAFTGQRADAVSGLDYYGSRYYDPVAGQFTSGDSVLPGGGLDLWGLSRYAYVEGNPVDRTDPGGHMFDSGGGCGYSCSTGGGGALDPYEGHPPPITGGNGSFGDSNEGYGGCCDAWAPTYWRYTPPPPRPRVWTPRPAPRPATHINRPAPRVSCCTTLPVPLPGRGIMITTLPPFTFHCCSTPVSDWGRSNTMYDQKDEGPNDSRPSKRPGVPDPGYIQPGSSSQDVIDKLPPHIRAGGVATRKGDGTRYHDPDRPGDQVRIMLGDPSAPDPLHQGPYVVISKNGRETRIPLSGNPTT